MCVNKVWVNKKFSEYVQDKNTAKPGIAGEVLASILIRADKDEDTESFKDYENKLYLLASSEDEYKRDLAICCLWSFVNKGNIQPSLIEILEKLLKSKNEQAIATVKNFINDIQSQGSGAFAPVLVELTKGSRQAFKKPG